MNWFAGFSWRAKVYYRDVSEAVLPLHRPMWMTWIIPRNIDKQMFLMSIPAIQTPWIRSNLKMGAMLSKTKNWISKIRSFFVSIFIWTILCLSNWVDSFLKFIFNECFYTFNGAITTSQSFFTFFFYSFFFYCFEHE